MGVFRLAVSLVTLAAYVSAQCGQEDYYDYEGNITSPSFPDTYPVDLRCTYTISADPGNVILLDFTSFNIEIGRADECYSTEFVRIYDGNDTDAQELSWMGNSELCGELSGGALPHFQSSGQYLTIEFYSDDHDESSMDGWSANYHQYTPDTAPMFLDADPETIQYGLTEQLDLECGVEVWGHSFKTVDFSIQQNGLPIAYVQAQQSPFGWMWRYSMDPLSSTTESSTTSTTWETTSTTTDQTTTTTDQTTTTQQGTTTTTTPGTTDTTWWTSSSWWGSSTSTDSPAMSWCPQDDFCMEFEEVNADLVIRALYRNPGEFQSGRWVCQTTTVDELDFYNTQEQEIYVGYRPALLADLLEALQDRRGRGREMLEENRDRLRYLKMETRQNNFRALRERRRLERRLGRLAGELERFGDETNSRLDDLEATTSTTTSDE